MNQVGNVSFVSVLLAFVIFIGSLLAARLFICWFFKINQIVKLLTQIEANTRPAGAVEEVPKLKGKALKLVSGMLPENAASRVRAAIERGVKTK